MGPSGGPLATQKVPRVLWLDNGRVRGSSGTRTPRFRRLRLIASTPQLDWLLLTKRPENVEPLLKRLPSPLPGFTGWDDWCQETNQTAWLGVSVENQAAADERIPILLSIPPRVRFLAWKPCLNP